MTWAQVLSARLRRTGSAVAKPGKTPRRQAKARVAIEEAIEEGADEVAEEEGASLNIPKETSCRPLHTGLASARRGR